MLLTLDILNQDYNVRSNSLSLKCKKFTQSAYKKIFKLPKDFFC